MDQLLGHLSGDLKDFVLSSWAMKAREEQLPPEGAWNTWLLLGGRGSGKTRAGAEWIRALALGDPLLVKHAVGRIALIADTMADAREVMIEGPSGLLAVHANNERPEWKSSRRRLEWNNGAVAQVFSSEDPDALRGPQFGAAWGDELAKWNNAEATWNMLQFGLRLGPTPQQMFTTTPRNAPLLKRLLKDDRVRISRMATDANRAHLSPTFFEAIVGQYRGTRLGRQELDAELIEDRADALWQRDALERLRASSAPPLSRIVVAVDPPITSTARSDRCGIVVAGISDDGVAHVLADHTMSAVQPSRWAAMTLEAFKRWEADLVVIETNQGGDMAETVLRTAEPNLPIRQVKASRGKYLRAEPIAQLYERGRVRHVGALPELEDEMCDFGLAGLSNGRSPDRLDALVWALTELMIVRNQTPRARTL